MKLAAPAALLVLILTVACGKVGDPKAPINRTPQQINDLRVSQSGERVMLVWTNPGKYVDNNDINDLAFVRILQNGVEAKREVAGPAGQPQSSTVDVKDSLNTPLTFSVQLETKRGKVSTLSTEVPIEPVDVPGVPGPLRFLVDQRRIVLDWNPPLSKPDLASGYLVQRSDRPAGEFVPTNHFEDADYEADKKYEYTVTAVRGEKRVAGTGGVSGSVTAEDKKEPAVPTGLVVDPAGTGVLLTWQANTERDFKEVWVYRSDRPAVILIRRSVNGYPDTTYLPGLSYWLVAVDEFGNESEKSAPVAGP